MSVQETNLKAIADAIREKDGTSDLIVGTELANRVLNIVGKTDDVSVDTGNYQDDRLTEIANAIRIAEGSTDKIDSAEFAERILGIEVKPITPSILPEGYTQLQYIENTNRAYIGDIITTPAWVYQHKIELTVGVGSVSGTIFGNDYQGQYVTDKNTIRISQMISGTVANRINFIFGDDEVSSLTTMPSIPSFSGNTLDASSIVSGNETMVIKVNSYRDYYVDSQRLYVSSITNDRNFSTPYNYKPNVNPALFGYASSSFSCGSTSTSCTLKTSYSTGNMKLYNLKIYKSSVLINDYYPCTSPSGIVGIYDIITDSFKSSATTNSLVAGPEV